MINEFKRSCPSCLENIIYNSYNSFYKANKRNSKCNLCNIKRLSGETNPFYGKHHTKETKNIISNFNSNIRKLSDDILLKLRANIKNVSNKRAFYDIWLEKFGKDIADQKLLVLKQKQSINNSGSKNPMYGKPSPQGSGNGWSGWYKNWYFRSLRELSYMINVIEKDNLIWKTPNKSFNIKYIDYAGKNRNYFPDFIINENKIVEIKPLKLHNTPKILSKRKAAEDFCKIHNMIYEIIDPVILDNDTIKSLYINGNIKFIDRYDKKFKERFMNNE